MKNWMRVCLYVAAITCLATLLGVVGCSKAPSDSQMASDIQNKLNADSGLQGKQLVVQVANGTVTLSGPVDTDAERDAAAKYASSEPGVKQVVNNLDVTSAVSQTPPPAQVPVPAPAPESSKPSAASRRHHHRDHESSVDNNSYSANNDTQPVPNSPTPMADAGPINTPSAAPPPPPPTPQKVTIPSGTSLAVRLIDPLNSETAQSGQTFHATLNAPLFVEGTVAVPARYDVEGHVVNVQSAGKFAGQSLLVLQLDRVKVGDRHYDIQTDQYQRKAASRSKNTGEKVGGGALLGAIIGGLAGGGKGAGIGAAAGAGLGGGVQAASKSQQIDLPSETVLNFTLQAPLTVIPTTQGPNRDRPRLETNQ